MMPNKPPQPDRNDQGTKSKGTPPALKLSSRCPNCGRTGVVVFSVPPPTNSPDEETHRLVCLHCAPKAGCET
jgi:hypothetical protein